MIRRLAQILFISLVALSIYRLLSTAQRFESDPLALLESGQEGSSERIRAMPEGIKLMREQLKSQSKKVLVLLWGEDIAERSQVKQTLFELLEHEFEPANRGQLLIEKLKREASFIRPQLLTKEQLKLISSPNAVADLTNSIRAKLSSLNSGYYRTWLNEDPLLLIPEFLLSLNQDISSKKAEVSESKKDQQYEILEFESKVDTLQASEQQRLVEIIDIKLSELKSLYPSIGAEWLGYIRFAESSARQIRREISWTSTAATLFILVTILVTFRTFQPFLWSCISSTIGIVVASAISSVYFKDLHLFTLAVGAALSGAAVDYSLHFFSHYYVKEDRVSLSANNQNAQTLTGEGVISSSGRSLLFGAITSSAAFLSLAFTQLVALEQMALFCVSSLLASFLTVYLLFPLIYRAPAKKVQSLGIEFSYKMQLAIKGYFQQPSGKGCLVILALVSIYGFGQLKSNNDIRSFQSRAAELSLVEEQFKSHGAALDLGSTLVIDQASYASLDLVFEKLTRLVSQGVVDLAVPLEFLQAGLNRGQASSIYYQFINSKGQALEQALKQLGLAQNLIEKALFLPKSVEKSDTATLSLLSDNNGRVTLPLRQVNDLAALKSSFNDQPEVRLLNYAETVSDLLEQQMIRSIWVMLLAYLAILTWGLCRYGLKGGGLLMAFVLLVGSSSLALVAWLGIALNFFSLLGLIIVLGLCVDFGIFYLEDKDLDSNFSASATSIVSSSITSVGAFSVLVFSSAPVLVSFGAIICVGVLVSMLLAPMTTLATCQKN